MDLNFQDIIRDLPRTDPYTTKIKGCEGFMLTIINKKTLYNAIITISKSSDLLKNQFLITIIDL